MTTTPDSTRCRHVTCGCTVEPSLAYCCEYCARADQQPGTEQQREVCECGHPECRRAHEEPAREAFKGVDEETKQ